MTNILTSSEIHSLMEEDYQLIDVRTKSEFENKSLPGAKNVPIKNLKHKSNELDNNKPIIVFCHTGGRSAKAQSILRQQGFSQVHNAGSLCNFPSI